jgi:hypothetical protein
VHIRTVHDGEKRFVCGETDLSTSKRVTGWSAADGCGKRYGSKLALEEHIRTAHLGFLNSKAERRQKLGQPRKSSSSTNNNLSALTGEGYADETGRQITCFVESCSHRFHRNYDLWVHMGSKHSYTEDDIRGFFLQRALLGDNSEPVPGDVFGIYGLEFDDEDHTYNQDLDIGAYPNTPAETAGAGAGAYTAGQDQHQLPNMNIEPYTLEPTEFSMLPQSVPMSGCLDPDIMMQEPASVSASKSQIPSLDNDVMLNESFLDFGMVNS